MSGTADPIERTAYVDTFFKELAPAWLNYVAALHGVRPRALDQPFTYIELGCGFGQTVVTNAAAHPQARFFACDINPEHVDGARQYARALGVTNLEDDERNLEVAVADADIRRIREFAARRIDVDWPADA